MVHAGISCINDDKVLKKNSGGLKLNSESLRNLTQEIGRCAGSNGDEGEEYNSNNINNMDLQQTILNDPEYESLVKEVIY